MNLVLVGYRGTGKSTVAQLLWRKLQRDVVVLDAEIERQMGRTIRELVEHKGWDAFRAIEARICGELAALDNVIIDAGGGVVLRDENVANLRRNGRIFWLTASTPIIAARIGGDTNRPSLTGDKSFVDEIEDVLAVRRPLYQRAAEAQFDTDTKTPDEVANCIVAHLAGHSIREE